MNKLFLLPLCLLLFNMLAKAQNYNTNKFRQLKQELSTPNIYRTASGAPGHAYWQQQADYVIDITLDEEKNRIYGDEVITYHNQSPDELNYLWIQLDQNARAKDSDSYKIRTSEMTKHMSFSRLKRFEHSFDGGFKIEHVKNHNNQKLSYIINKTMMRVDLPQPLKPGGTFKLKIKWWYNVNDRAKVGGRSGFEHFEEENNNIYTIAQFYPRMAVYNEVEGWQNKQFLGGGEFALPFGNFTVNITVPADHIVGATGLLQNPDEVLSPLQQARMEKAQKTKRPVFIVTEAEARQKEQLRSEATKTWTFKAENVRDFAFASSRKFIWDAMKVELDNKKVLAMSMYPREGNPLWEKYSTRVVAHTLQTYSKYTFDYPYPVATSVHTKNMGMEYPMICFNGGRPEADGTYSKSAKYSMIGVVIHEVGHNFFPMIVNSDERQWTWMDEGLNTFLQFLTEQEWEPNYPSQMGRPSSIVSYMKGDKNYISPIMTNSESLWHFGDNAYNKPAAALNILRETVMGRELFDFAFKQYAQRWKFKHPTPADFFRTMEDASGVDLDWFWRGWFYTTDHCDIALENVSWYKPNTQNPNIEMPLRRESEQTVSITDLRNEKSANQTYTARHKETEDFYTTYDEFAITDKNIAEYKSLMAGLSDTEKEKLSGKYNFYQIDFANKGGLVMPIILRFDFEDNTSEVVRIPAEIWKKDSENVSKVFVLKKEVKQVVLDPFKETADTDENNNYWPQRKQPTRFQLYKSRYSNYKQGGTNPMRRAQQQSSGNN